MLEASTTGHAQLKHKTINAEVNLLAEWQRGRDQVSEQIARVSIALALVALLAVGSVPFLLHAFQGANQRLLQSQGMLKGLSGQLDSMEGAKKAAKPRLDQGAMHETVIREANQFLGQTVKVMNSGSPEMALDTITSNVIGGELTIQCTADAENNAIAQTFIQQAGLGSNVNSTLLSAAQKNGRLAPDGVGFAYEKRIEVNR
jgi:hypothetical protein